MLKAILILLAAVFLVGCTATAEKFCYKNKMYYPNDSKICGDIKLVTVKGNGVNLTGNYVEIN